MIQAIRNGGREKFGLPLGNECILDGDRNFALKQVSYGPLKELLLGVLTCEERGAPFTRDIGYHSDDIISVVVSSSFRIVKACGRGSFVWSTSPAFTNTCTTFLLLIQFSFRVHSGSLNKYNINLYLDRT